MKAFYRHHKKSLCIVVGIFVILCSLLAGAVIGIQYFYEEFVAAKTAFKETFGIVTAADLALLAEEEGEALPDTDNRIITINGHETWVDCYADSFTWFDTYELSTLTENTFVFGDLSGYDVWFEGEAVETGSVVTLSIDTLSVAYGLELMVTNQYNGVTKYYYIRTLPSSYNAVSYGEGEGEGYYYFTSQTTMYKMDTAGNVVYYKDDGVTVRDFKQTIVDDTVYYSYLRYAGDDASTTSQTLFEAVVMDKNYQEIDLIEYLSTEQGMPEQTALDDHEFLILGENHYMVLSYVYQEVDNVPTEISEDGTSYVTATVVQELQDGALVFQWCSTDYPELYAYSVRASRLGDESVTNAVDYLHGNSIAIDPADGNYVFSFRAMSGLIKVDSETAEIIWILGGEGDDFNLSEEQEMSYQHFPQYWNGDTLTVFDNGNDYAQTRILEYVLDEETMTVTSFTAYQIDGWYSASMGSSMRVSDESPLYLVGWGQAEENNIVFSEINFETGEVLFQLIDLDCADSLLASSYRAYKFDS